MHMQSWRWTILICMLCLSACSHFAGREPAPSLYPPKLVSSPDFACLASFESQRQPLLADASFSQPMAGLPALRINRTLAQWRFSALSTAQQLDWLMWSHQLALETAQTLGLVVSPCPQSVWRLALQSDAFLAKINAVEVPDEYRDWLRVVGLYPITRLPFAAGVRRELEHQAQLQAQYQSRALSPRRWHLYQVPIAQPAPGGSTLKFGFTDPLQSELSEKTAAALLEAWAPTFAIEQGTAEVNIIGRIGRAANGRLGFDVDSTSGLYAYVSLGQFLGQPVLQLNYQVWFAARPPKSSWDPLAGVLDGIHWRVHLDSTGHLLAADTMHTCGCWYQVYPAQGYDVDTLNSYWQEPVFVGEALPSGASAMVLVAADDHSVVGVREVPLGVSAKTLQVIDLSYASMVDPKPLSSAALAYRRSFDRDGIIPESARSERYFFWPMGIPKAGSMRASGHHAVAFTGRLHFDDPLILERVGLIRRR